MLFVTAEIQIPAYELEFSYARSSGPGGQNVNKVNSKAILKWNVRNSPSLPPGPRARFMERFGMRLTTEGILIVTSDRHRDQGRNRQDCLDKLAEMLREIAVAPRHRKKTKPSYSSTQKRQNKKSKHGEKKRLRGRVPHD